MNNLRFVAVLLLCAGFGSTDIRACGDKFLVRGSDAPKPQLLTDPVRILVYETGSDPQVEEMNQNLVDAGHTVWRVQEESDFEGMLEGADVDLVITGLENAQSIKPEVSREHPGIKILPYLALPTHAERSAAKREFGEALAMPNTPKVLLTVVAKATLNKR